MNIIDLQERLKDFPEQALMQEMQAPSGMAPQFLVLSELKRRKRMRDEYQRAQAADMKTVAEEAITGAGVPQGDIMQMAGAMAPNTNVAQDNGIDDAMQRVPTQAPQPPQEQGIASIRGMAAGGYVKKMQQGTLVGAPQSVVIDGKQYLVLPNGGVVSPLGEPVSFAEAERAKIAASGQPVFGGALVDVSTDIADFDATQGFKELPLGEGDAARLLEGIGVGEAAGLPVAPAVSSADAATVDQEKNIPPGLDLLRESMRNINIGAAAEAGRIGLNLPAYMSSDAMAAGSFEPEPQETLTQQLARRIAEIDARIAASQDNPDLVRALENQRSSMVFGLEATEGLEGATQAINQAASDLAAATGEAALGAAAGATDIAGTAVSPFNPELAARLYAASRGMAPEGAAPEPVPEAAQAAEAARMLDLNEIPERPRMVTDAGELIGEPTTPPAPPTTPPAPPGGGGGGGGGVGGFGPIESRIAQMLAEREKSAAADKWLALAQTGLALMASRQPTIGGAIGEAGLAGIGAMRQARNQYDKDVLGLLEMQAGIQRAKASGARAATPDALKMGDLADLYSSLQGRLSTVLSEIAKAETPDPLTGQIDQAPAYLKSQAAQLATQVDRIGGLLGITGDSGSVLDVRTGT
jgi:hypothetical protein